MVYEKLTTQELVCLLLNPKSGNHSLKTNFLRESYMVQMCLHKYTVIITFLINFFYTKLIKL